MGGGRANKEAKWLQSLASVASASLEIRGVRFTFTAVSEVYFLLAGLLYKYSSIEESEGASSSFFTVYV